MRGILVNAADIDLQSVHARESILKNIQCLILSVSLLNYVSVTRAKLMQNT